MNTRIVATIVLSAVVAASCGESSGSAAPAMPDVVGLQLDVALSGISRAGIEDEVEVLGGGTFGVIDESNWKVCEQLPDPGAAVSEAPRVTVDRSCPGDEESGSAEAAPAASATPTTIAEVKPPVEPVDETLTIEHSPELAALLTGTDCGDSVAAFATANGGRTIEFDGNIANLALHGDLETRFDVLIHSGDYGVASRGPAMQFRNKTAFDLNLTGPNVPPKLSGGENVRIVAEVSDYEPASCLLLLEPVSTQIR